LEFLNLFLIGNVVDRAHGLCRSERCASPPWIGHPLMAARLAETRRAAAVGHGSYLWHFGEIERECAMLTFGSMGRWGSRIGWEVEMNDDGQQSSLGGHVGKSVVGDSGSLGAFYRS
jgi:hypothetical protein